MGSWSIAFQSRSKESLGHQDRGDFNQNRLLYSGIPRIPVEVIVLRGGGPPRKAVQREGPCLFLALEGYDDSCRIVTAKFGPGNGIKSI